MDLNLNNFENNKINLILLKEITINSFSDWIFENTFIIFKSINNLYLLIYATKIKSIICYNMNKYKIMTELKNSHEEYITNFKHCYSNHLKSDLIMSVSRNDNNIKIWDTRNFHCLFNLKNINKDGLLNSASFLNYNNNIYIITCNRNWSNPEPIKVFDLNEKKIREIKDSKNNSFFIDVYYDKKSKANESIYIITGNEGNLISYDYIEDQKYNKYFENNENDIFHHSLVIYEDKDITKMIETSDGNGIIRIWDFHTSQLLKKINTSDNALRGICLWNKDYAFVGCGDKTIKIIELDNGKIINSLIGHSNNVCSFKIIFHPKYGKCIISQGHESDQIKMWVYKEYNFKKIK